eukprot:323986-Pleurochrysis_carterae.AAC.1
MQKQTRGSYPRSRRYYNTISYIRSMFGRLWYSCVDSKQRAACALETWRAGWSARGGSAGRISTTGCYMNDGYRKSER